MPEEIIETSNGLGRDFEEEVRDFLSNTLNFSDVKGGPDFHIAPEGKKNQIDACGRFDDILFVFECKAAGKKTKKHMRQDILASHSRSKIILENYKRIPEYKNCKVVRYIFITKRIEIPDTEKDLIKEFYNPSMFYADEHMLEYYTDLNDKIGNYSVYSFLADFKIFPSPHEELKILAMKNKLGKYTSYSFYVEPKKLLKFAYVARRRKQKEDFYQRMLDKTRINKIKSFLDNGGIFPTNVIISLKEGEKSFEKIDIPNNPNGPEVGILTIKGSYNACWIVDGQHRLYSHSESESNSPLSCIAFESLEIEEERRFFLEINKEQKPIQPDLIWDLEGLSNPESPRGIISNIVRTLDDVEDGPFFGKIYIPVRGSKSGKMLNMAAFCNGIANSGITRQMTSNCTGIMNPLFDDKYYRMTKNVSRVLLHYFSLINERLSEEHKDFVFGNAGIPIMLYLLEPIVAKIRRSPTSGDLNKYADFIDDFFKTHFLDSKSLRNLKQETNSEGARKNIAKKIGLFIRLQGREYSNFWPEMEQNETVTQIISMERRLAELISDKLSEISSNWESSLVPQEIYRIAKKRAEKDGTTFEENLDLSDALQIISSPKNWSGIFSKIFLQKDGFLGLEELKVAFNYLGMVRNPSAHGKTITYTKEDLSHCELYLQKLERIVPEILEDKDTDVS